MLQNRNPHDCTAVIEELERVTPISSGTRRVQADGASLTRNLHSNLTQTGTEFLGIKAGDEVEVRTYAFGILIVPVTGDADE